MVGLQLAMSYTAKHPAALLVLGASILCVVPVQSFSTGPPVEACGTLSPDPLGHGAPPQSSASPWQVDLFSLDNGGSGSGAGATGNYSYIPGRKYLRMFLLCQ